MQALQLGEEYWHMEIEEYVRSGRIPQQLLSPLRGLVNAVLGGTTMRVIRPTTSDEVLALYREFLASGIVIGNQLYRLAVFVPDEPSVYRQFVDLVPWYPGGRMVPIESL